MLILKDNLKMMKLNIKLFAIAFMLLGFAQVKAQTTDADKAAQYTKTITDRSNKIVAALGITDSAKYKRVLAATIDEYRMINDIHNDHNDKVKQLKATVTDKADLSKQTGLLDTAMEVQLDKMHNGYISKLNKDLNAKQIEKVKDLMTYNVLPITYKAYCEEVLTLTDAQKAKIMGWLVEAREHAIDAESSDKKHAVFGKYKGRINNYLSAQGYDMKKEGEEWQKRIKAAQGGK
jgi:hypothetical protein